MQGRTVRGPTGFSLLEMLIAVAILAIVTAIAVPSFAGLLSERRASTAARTYATALRRAQAEAIARNRTIEVLFTAADPVPANVLTATPVASAGATRWMVRRLGPVGADDFIDGHTLTHRTPTVTITSTAATVGFTPLGRPVDVVGANVAALADTVVVRFSDGPAGRRFCTYLTTGGAVKVCDPLLETGQPLACQPHLPVGDC